MINKRLISEMGDSKKYIYRTVAFQWLALIFNIIIMSTSALFLQNIYYGKISVQDIYKVYFTVVLCIVARYICIIMTSRMSYQSSKQVRLQLRNKIYTKLLAIGSSYKENVRTSEIVQVAVEGVDQLDTYFGTYLPQFFYAMIAPITLFVVIAQINIYVAVVLLICVPLIPVAIVAVQRWAKKLLSKYWGQYTNLGDTFLENLQGMTTLKIYKADEMKNQQMNQEAENFRKITMRVLTMQLNSITIMDIVAYGGAALGIIIAITQFGKGNIDIAGAILIILLSAEFFIPMRQLGSFFHIAMNGMAASDKIFKLLDMPVSVNTEQKEFPQQYDIKLENVKFSYNSEREILNGISMAFKENGFTAVVGESGCGKSTVASLLTGKNKQFSGEITIGGISVKDIQEQQLMKNITYVSHNDYIFKGTVRENLDLSGNNYTDDAMWQALSRVNLAPFFKSLQGLDTQIGNKGENLSGGQCQRLALARAILHDSQIYIFDEAASNIDAESENDIMKRIYEMSKSKTIILISHRLANVTDADMIYVMNKGLSVENGTHSQLMDKNGTYAKLYNAQMQLENYGVEV